MVTCKHNIVKQCPHNEDCFTGLLPCDYDNCRKLLIAALNEDMPYIEREEDFSDSYFEK